MKQRPFSALAVLWIVLMTAVLASSAALLISGRTQAQSDEHWVSQQDFETLQRYRRLEEIRETLMRDYYLELDEDSLVLGAIRGMTASIGDPYTFYYTPEEMTKANEDTEGIYHGVGVVIQRSEEGYILVLRVYEGSPAEKAGMRVGDVVMAVNGEAIDRDSLTGFEEAIDAIRGEAGTTVTLTLRRDGEVFDLEVERADLNVSYAEYQMLEDGIGYVSITQFSGDAADRFNEALDFFRLNGAKGMVIDLRNNPGGLLDTVLKIADPILPTGIIVYVKDRDGTRQDYYSDENCYDVPVAVLVNDMSASASEILAAAVQAHDRGVVVGLTTYGKGIVQTLFNFEDGAGIQLTTQSYYDADDRSIHGTGVTPDVEVALDMEYIPLEPDPVSDNQLAAAIREVERQFEADADIAA